MLSNQSTNIRNERRNINQQLGDEVEKYTSDEEDKIQVRHATNKIYSIKMLKRVHFLNKEFMRKVTDF